MTPAVNEVETASLPFWHRRVFIFLTDAVFQISYRQDEYSIGFAAEWYQALIFSKATNIRHKVAFQARENLVDVELFPASIYSR